MNLGPDGAKVTFPRMAGTVGKTRKGTGQSHFTRASNVNPTELDGGLTKTVRNSLKEMVSAAGLEPATHALKGVRAMQTKDLHDLLGGHSELL